MGKKTEFHAVEFVRRLRDRQALALRGKSPREIVAYFAAAAQRTPRPAVRRKATRRQAPGTQTRGRRESAGV
jgi:hypothetical protein